MIVSWVFVSDGAFGGPDGDLLGRAEIDPGEAQVEKAFALVQRVEADQGAVLIDGGQLDQGAVLEAQAV